MKQELQKQIDQFKDQLRALSDKVNGLPEQEFEVGKWVKIISGGSGAYGVNGLVGRIVNKPAESVDYHGEFAGKTNVFIELPNGEVWGLGNRYAIEYATSLEVQEALTKEAVKRGFKEGVVFNDVDNDIRGKNCVFDSFTNYFPDKDVLQVRTKRYTWGENYSNPYIYRKGQWAEIVKDQPITICGKEVVYYERSIKIHGLYYSKDTLRKMRYLLIGDHIKYIPFTIDGVEQKVDLQLIESLINRINKG